MKIYLVLIDHERFFFFADGSDSSSDDADESNPTAARRWGLRGWIDVQWVRFRSAWEHPHSDAMRWARRIWDWLHSWAHPDEAMLSRLWKARSITLAHPSSRTDEEVRGFWQSYLDQQWWQHLFWMGFNGLIAPFALITLWILPGPNLIGYWFLYRAIHHALVLWGIRRVRHKRIATEFCPMETLDLPVEHDDAGKATHALFADASALLDEHVAWHEKSRPNT